MTSARLHPSVFVILVGLLTALASCGGDPGKQPASPESPPDAIAGETGEGADGAAGGGAEDSAGASGGEGPPAEEVPVVPEKGDPADHFLGHGDLFAGHQAYDRGNVYVEPVVEITPPGATGEGEFKLVRTGALLTTAHFWKTHKAAASELEVGVIALMADRKDAQGIYAAPRTVDEAYAVRWWLARIASVKPLEPKGFVWVAGGYKVAADAIRILEGDGSPALQLDGEEDAHFVRADHWFSGDSPLPVRGNSYAQLSAQVRPFEGGEGRFVALHDGRIFDTSHAWKTRIAAPKEIEKGRHVLVPDMRDGSTYRAPRTRKEALFSRWWWVKVVEKKGKKTVVVEGDYEVELKALRVLD
jgi:hypothetical protein